jgi:hypothetical protein
MPTKITSAGITFNDNTSLTSANIGTAQLVNGAVTTPKLGTNEQKAIAKAWVKYDGYIGGYQPAISGTYIQSGTTTVTVTTATPHGLIDQQFIFVDILTGGQSDNNVAVTVVSPTVYTYIAASSLFTNGAIDTYIWIDLVGTYNGDGTTATTTVTTLTPHGLTNGQLAYLSRIEGGTSFTTQLYTITVVSGTVFTFVSSNTMGTSVGRLLIGLPYIRSSYNISSIAYVSTSNMTVNFITPMNDTNYAVVATSTQNGSSSNFGLNNITTTSFRITFGSNSTFQEVNLAIYGN